MRRGTIAILVAFVCCFGIETILECVYNNKTWPSLAFEISDILIFATFGLGGAGSLWSIVVISRRNLRCRIGVVPPISILCLTIFISVRITIHDIAYYKAQSVPTVVVVPNATDFILDGTPLSANQFPQASRDKRKRFGSMIPVNVWADGRLTFEQLGPLWRGLNFFIATRFGMTTNQTSPGVLIRPGGIDVDFSRPMVHVNVFLEGNKYRLIEFGSDTNNLGTTVQNVGNFGIILDNLKKKDHGCFVTLHCSSNTLYSVFCEIAEICSMKGVDSIFYTDN